MSTEIMNGQERTGISNGEERSGIEGFGNGIDGGTTI